MPAKKNKPTELVNLPPELFEEILLNLPIKSLYRSSAVSKSWNSMIFCPEFMKRYRGRELVVLQSYSNGEALAIPLSSISSLLSPNPNPNSMDETTPFVFPFTYPYPYPYQYPYPSTRASCGELWCVEFQASLILYNPSIQRYRRLPTSSATHHDNSFFVYGLGYDSAGDDYKVVKIHIDVFATTELYSLKTDRWRKIESPPIETYHQFLIFSKEAVFVNGALHWLVTIHHRYTGECYGFHILRFHLSEERYGVFQLPQLPELTYYEDGWSRRSGLIAFGGKLRVYIDYVYHSRFSVWVIEDFETQKWRKEVEMNYAYVFPFPSCLYANLKPFYFYDDDENVIKAVTSSVDPRRIFICGEEENGTSSVVEKSLGNGSFGCSMFDTYVESFVSVWPGQVRSDL